ncbi:Ribose ABC transporter permease protein, partial [Dysosmobacter welbionis]
MVIQHRHSLVHALVEGVGVQLVSGEAVGIPHRHQILPAEFHRLHPDSLTDIVDVALPGPHGLGDPITTHGAGGGAVGVDRPAVALQIVAGVELGEGAHALGHDAVAVGGVGPLVGPGLKLPGHQGAVRPDVGDDVGADGVADPVRDKGLLPAALQMHQPSPHLGGEPGAQRLVQSVLLVAKAAADVGLDDPHLAPGQTQCLPHHPADDVGDLGGGDHHHPARLLIGEAAVVFNVAVLDSGGVVPALHPDQARLLDGGLIVASADICVLQNIAGAVLVDLWGIRLHGLLHVQNEGQLLILHLQRPDGLSGSYLVLRDDGGDVVAVIPHVMVQQQPVRHVLVGGICGPGVSRCGEAVIGHVEASQDLHHTG